MAEKVVIKSATDTGKTWQDKKIIKVELSDGRTGSSFDSNILEFNGKEADLDIKEGKEFNGVKQYIFNLPKKAGAFPKKDYTVDKKIAALSAASRMQGIKSEQVLELANKYYTWLNG